MKVRRKGSLMLKPLVSIIISVAVVFGFSTQEKKTENETGSNQKSVGRQEKQEPEKELLKAQKELAAFKADLLKSETQIARFKELFGPNDPTVIQLQKKVAMMRKKLRQLDQLGDKKDGKPSTKSDASGSSYLAKNQDKSSSEKSAMKDGSATSQEKAPSSSKAEGTEKGETADVPAIPIQDHLNELRKQWNDAVDEDQKKEVKAKLVEVLEQQFDRDLKVREEKLVAAEKRLARLRSQFETMVKSKKKIVNTYADATTTSWEHPGILDKILENRKQVPKPSDVKPSFQNRYFQNRNERFRTGVPFKTLPKSGSSQTQKRIGPFKNRSEQILPRPGSPRISTSIKSKGENKAD